MGKMEIRLRQIEREDLPQLRDWRNSDKVRNRTREYRLLNMVDKEDWFERISRDRNNEMFGVEILADCNWQLVGICGLCYIAWVNRTAEISIYVVPPYQEVSQEVLELLRRKAFDEFNLHRLWAETYDFLTEYIQIFENMGFRREGVLRHHAYCLGDYHDSILWGYVRDVDS